MTRFTIDPKEMHYSGSPLYVVPREDPEGEWVRFSDALNTLRNWGAERLDEVRMENARLSAALQASQTEVARLTEEKEMLGRSIDMLLLQGVGEDDE